MSNAEEMEQAGNWHLDKRVNISIIAVLIGQAAIGVWQVSKMDSRTTYLEKEVLVLQRNVDEDRKAAGLIREDLREIKTMLKVLAEKR
jgi:hypothetical protein